MLEKLYGANNAKFENCRVISNSICIFRYYLWKFQIEYLVTSDCKAKGLVKYKVKCFIVIVNKIMATHDPLLLP